MGSGHNASKSGRNASNSFYVGVVIEAVAYVMSAELELESRGGSCVSESDSTHFMTGNASTGAANQKFYHF